MTPLVTVADAVTLALVMSRIVAIFMAMPFFNTPLLPTNIKVFLVLALSFYLMRIDSLSLDISQLDLATFTLLLFKELLIGFALGLLANIFVTAFSYAAEMISYFMGMTVVSSFDPTYGQVSALGKFFIMIFYLLFFVTGAYRYFLGSIVESFATLPLGMLHFDQGLWQFVIELSKNIFILSFQLAFPFALILYMVNLALALVNRMIPQINVFIVGLPLQIFVGIASLAFGASVLLYVGSSILSSMTQEYLYLLKNLG